MTAECSQVGAKVAKRVDAVNEEPGALVIVAPLMVMMMLVELT